MRFSAAALPDSVMWSIDGWPRPRGEDASACKRGGPPLVWSLFFFNFLNFFNFFFFSSQEE